MCEDKAMMNINIYIYMNINGHLYHRSKQNSSQQIDPDRPNWHARMLLRSLAKLGLATLLLDPARLENQHLFENQHHLRINRYQQISTDTDINRFRMKWAWDKCLEILRERERERERERDWFWKHSLRWCAFLIQISHRYPYRNRNQWNGVTIWHKLARLDMTWHSLT